MAGRNLPKVSYNGIDKDYWIEGKDSYARIYNDPSSTHINYELLALRGDCSKEHTIPPADEEKIDHFIQLGRVSLNLK